MWKTKRSGDKIHLYISKFLDRSLDEKGSLQLNLSSTDLIITALIATGIVCLHQVELPVLCNKWECARGTVARNEICTRSFSVCAHCLIAHIKLYVAAYNVFVRFDLPTGEMRLDKYVLFIIICHVCVRIMAPITQHYYVTVRARRDRERFEHNGIKL